MRFAIFGDIHANLHALKVVLADAETHLCSHFVYMGDVVGYNAYPSSAPTQFASWTVPPSRATTTSKPRCLVIKRALIPSPRKPSTGRASNFPTKKKSGFARCV